MDQFTFALISMLGVPFALIALVFLAHRLIPKAIWFGAIVQTIATLAIIGTIAAPIAILQIDSQGEYFDDKTALVTGAFALPDGAKVDHQRDRTLRLGDCWRNAVNWRSTVEFPSARAFDQWYAQDTYRQSMIAQIAEYFGEPQARITVAPGALDRQSRDPRHVLSDKVGSYSRNTRILEFSEPFVCTAIERNADGAITLRRCDPIAQPADIGSEGWVIINPSAKNRTLEGRILYARGPSYCTNPMRRAVNHALGLPHPGAGEPNTNIGGILPIF